MSIRENIEIYHPIDVDEYLSILRNEFNARNHPSQTGSFLIGKEGLPFYEPRQVGDHISILSFNTVPLSDDLIQALINHPEIVGDEVVVRWTQEQELIVETTIGDLRKIAGKSGKEDGV